MTNYGYTRVSTDRQGLTGESLDVQLRMIYFWLCHAGRQAVPWDHEEWSQMGAAKVS